MTHICVSKLTIIGPDNGLSPGQCQAIIWTNAGILLIGPLGTNFSEIVIQIQTFLLYECLLDFTDDQSTLVQVMAWCHQATSHYLSQCWQISWRHMASLDHNELICNFFKDYTFKSITTFASYIQKYYSYKEQYQKIKLHVEKNDLVVKVHLRFHCMQSKNEKGGTICYNFELSKRQTFFLCIKVALKIYLIANT